VNSLVQYGPISFDLRALRATSNKMMCKTTDSQVLKLKAGGN